MPRHERRRGSRAGTARSRSRWIVIAACAVLLAAVITSGTYAVVRAATMTPAGRSDVAAAETGSPKTSGPSASVHPSASSQPARGTTPAAPLTAAGCGGAANTPGGPDPWGGCWPGAGNTGVPAGTSLSGFTGSCDISRNTVITGKTVNCTLSVNSGNLTLSDSMVNGEVFNNGSGSVLIQDSTLNGGSDMSETVLGSNLTILSSNLYGNQHEVYCGGNCTIKDSWLHDNHDFGSSDHQNGFLSTGGSAYLLQHNSVYCVGGCTGDITFIPNDDVSDATVSRNLLVATPDAAYCLYPSSDHPSKPGVVSQMTVTGNVFQHGPNGKCAFYGPVYGWDDPTASPGTDGYGNVWSGNTWENGQPLDP
jgi:hypothetical protein